MDAALAAGESQRSTARRFDLSKSALQRHVAHGADETAPESAAGAPEMAPAPLPAVQVPPVPAGRAGGPLVEHGGEYRGAVDLLSGARAILAAAGAEQRLLLRLPAGPWRPGECAAVVLGDWLRAHGLRPGDVAPYLPALETVWSTLVVANGAAAWSLPFAHLVECEPLAAAIDAVLRRRDAEVRARPRQLRDQLAHAESDCGTLRRNAARLRDSLARNAARLATREADVERLTAALADAETEAADLPPMPPPAVPYAAATESNAAAATRNRMRNRAAERMASSRLPEVRAG